MGVAASRTDDPRPLRASTEPVCTRTIRVPARLDGTYRRPRAQVRVSVAPGGEALAAALADAGVCASVEDDAAHAASSKSAYDVVAPDALRARAAGFPLAQQFASLYLPLGHVKSTASDDDAFLEQFSASAKWLRVAE